jgi:hypothetical protein
MYGRLSGSIAHRGRQFRRRGFQGRDHAERRRGRIGHRQRDLHHPLLSRLQFDFFFEGNRLAGGSVGVRPFVEGIDAVADPNRTAFPLLGKIPLRDDRARREDPVRAHLPLLGESFPHWARRDFARLARLVAVGGGDQQVLPVALQAVLVAGEQAVALGRRAHGLHHRHALSAVLGDTDVRHLSALASRAKRGQLVVRRPAEVEIVDHALEHRPVLRTHVGLAERLRAGNQRFDLVIAQHEVAGNPVRFLSGNQQVRVVPADLDRLHRSFLGDTRPDQQGGETQGEADSFAHGGPLQHGSIIVSSFGCDGMNRRG